MLSKPPRISELRAALAELADRRISVLGCDAARALGKLEFEPAVPTPNPITSGLPA